MPKTAMSLYINMLKHGTIVIDQMVDDKGGFMLLVQMPQSFYAYPYKLPFDPSQNPNDFEWVGLQ